MIDSRIDQNYRSRKIVFNVSNNFKIIKIIGQGAYGTVCLAVHLSSGTKVAIKKIELFDKSLITLRTLREIKLLDKFRNHENIISLYDIQKPPDPKNFNEVYLIQEYMPCDLYNIINNQILTDEHVQYFTYQILRGIKMIHSANVIHRDLKPSNILINENCDLKICDFGLARLNNGDDIDNDGNSFSLLTEYVATRWYRAPEIMLNYSQYTTSIDLWSVGCILAELFIYSPLFPGSNYKNQLMLIFQLLGTPNDSDLNFIKSKKAKDYIRSLPVKLKIDFCGFFINHPNRHVKCNGEKINLHGLDLLKKLLVFNPENRITVDDALNHPYFRNYHDPDDEPITTPMTYSDFEFEFDKDKLDSLDLRKKIYKKIIEIRSR